MRLLGLVIVIVLAGALVILLLFAGEESASPHEESESLPAGMQASLMRSSQCAQCHREVYEEWVESQHEIAWKNPLVAQISEQFKNKICIDCHAPRPALESGLGKRVLARAGGRDDGVNCFSCHDRGDGSMAATTPGLEGACNPVADDRLSTVEHCSICHNQHGTVDEWSETDFAFQDPPVGCIECHMPRVERRRADGSTYVGREHKMAAAHDVDEIRKALVIEAAVADGALRIRVTNSGAGHNFPTDERARAADLVVRVLDPDGNLVGAEHRDRYRNPYRDEVGLKNTQIRWNETRSYEFPLGIPAGSVHVRLIYKLTPYIADDQGFLVHERTIEFP